MTAPIPQATASEPVVKLQGLEKRYGSIHALRGLDLEIPSGPIGLLGPNGAGKSTLLKLLLGQLTPSAGRALIAGYDPRRRADRLAVRRVVGYMPEGDCLMPRMNAVDLVSTLGRLAGLDARDAMTRSHEVLDYVGLDESRYRECDGYSTGMKQRLKLAQALVHDPGMLLLDEPTNGLDPKGRREMLDLVHDLGYSQGKNVLFCSHLLQDVERTCDRVVIIHMGAVLHTGDIEEMTRSEEAWMRVGFEGDGAAWRAALDGSGLQYRDERESSLLVQAPGGDGDRLFALASGCDVNLTSMTLVRSTLEDVFFRAVDEAGDE